MPKCWWESIQSPDQVAKLALADWFCEQGEELVADGLRWVVEKGRWTETGIWYGVPYEDFAYSHRNLPDRLLELLIEHLWDLQPATDDFKLYPEPLVGLIRLLRVWPRLSDPDRTIFWAWRPLPLEVTR